MALFPLFAAVAACPSDDSASSKPDLDAATAATGGSSSTGTGNPTDVIGTFTVSLVAPTDSEASGHTSIVGKVYDGPTPAQIVWEVAQTSDSCTLSTPRVPFCQESCGGSAVCVEDDKCQDYPTAHSVGTVKVTGVKTSTGASDFSMDPVAKTYQVPTGVALPFPAFDEGAEIKLAAAGGDYKAFTLTAHGVAPLTLGSEELHLTRGQPLALSWTKAASASASSVHVKLDISHHGGSKGMIECDSDDSGSLSIAGDLISALLDRGVAGFPTIIVTRHNDGSAQLEHGTVQLLVSSQVEQAVVVPGLISCSESSDCPSGQTCQSDLSCK